MSTLYICISICDLQCKFQIPLPKQLWSLILQSLMIGSCWTDNKCLCSFRNPCRFFDAWHLSLQTSSARSWAFLLDQSHFATTSCLVFRTRAGGAGYSQKNWVGVCGPLPKTITLFMTKICDIPYPIYDLTKNWKPNLWPDPHIKILLQTCILISSVV